jgi:hypothetical protein
LIGIENKTHVTIERIGNMMMPVEVFVMLKSGEVETYYFPLQIMFGEKKNEFPNVTRRTTEVWRWVDQEKTFEIPHKAENIAVILIDTTGRMADVNQENNVLIPSQYIRD